MMLGACALCAMFVSGDRFFFELAPREVVLSEMQSFPGFQADFPTSVTIGEYAL